MRLPRKLRARLIFLRTLSLLILSILFGCSRETPAHPTAQWCQGAPLPSGWLREESIGEAVSTSAPVEHYGAQSRRGVLAQNNRVTAGLSWYDYRELLTTRASIEHERAEAYLRKVEHPFVNVPGFDAYQLGADAHHLQLVSIRGDASARCTKFEDPGFTSYCDFFVAGDPIGMRINAPLSVAPAVPSIIQSFAPTREYIEHHCPEAR